MSKLTKWIKCRDQQPTLPGWYDVRWPYDRKAYAYRLRWTGKKWVNDGGVRFFTFDDSGTWRGLSENPSAPKEAV